MKRTINLLCGALATASLIAAQRAPAQRMLRPEDLFRVREVGATAWSPDGRYAAIEFTRPGATLDSTVPTNEIALLDVKARTLRTLSSNAPAYWGFFNALWSPDGRRLAFLSVDSNAVVRPWIWTAGAEAPTPLRDVDLRVGFEDPPIVWIGSDRIALLAWDIGAERSGNLYFRILRGRNVADHRRAIDAIRPRRSRGKALHRRLAPPTTVARPASEAVRLDGVLRLTPSSVQASTTARPPHRTGRR